MTEPHRWLVVTLEGPLVAFGGIAIDHLGVTRDFPALSMLTGLIGNALGYERTAWAAHQELQDRLVFAARRETESPTGLLTDVQNAKLEKNDRGWTTHGEPEGRDGNTYDSPHRRYRDYHMDAEVTVVLRLIGEGLPTLDQVADALRKPERPLFIGRKPCLPSAPLVGPTPFVVAADAYTAVQAVHGRPKPKRATWPAGEGPSDGADVDRVIALADLRNWRTGLHGGTRRVVEGRVTPQEAAP